MEEQAKVPVFKAGIIYGAIVGLASVVLSILIYFIGQSLETWAMILSPIVFLGLIILMLIMFRKEYGNGFAKFGQLVLLSFVIGLVTAIFTSVYSIAIYNMDEGYLQDTKYFAIEKIDKQFDKMDAKYQERLSDEQYSKVENELDKQRKKAIGKIKDRTPVAFALGGILNTVIISVLIGLIAGIFIRKEPKPVEV